MENKKEVKWYNNPSLITSLIIIVILLIIVSSQSFVIGEKMTLTLFGSIVNHNSVYLLVLVYFILIKFNIGKKYFNYLNIFLIFIYVITAITSGLTLVQSVSLNTILPFLLNILYVIYFVHVLLRDTRFWEEFSLDKSPFNELSNDSFYYSIISIVMLLLVINLVSTVVLSGLIISLLDTVYYVLIARYVYLYWEFLDSKKINIINSGNFDEIKESIQETIDEIDTKVQDVFDTKQLSDNIKDTVDNVINEIGDNEKKIVDTTVEEKKKKRKKKSTKKKEDK